ncbi:unnamed protein product [Spirodela intermedia]|uniref:Uncharacterized protein n=1 Tax=Spirodela intermedia TaxID=51605 RepID=A0A7I8LEC9_SPIIN|nr:unnamed protein product [Spirodela intermedia]
MKLAPLRHPISVQRKTPPSSPSSPPPPPPPPPQPRRPTSARARSSRR